MGAAHQGGKGNLSQHLQDLFKTGIPGQDFCLYFLEKSSRSCQCPVNYVLFSLCFYKQMRNSLTDSFKIFSPCELWSHFIFGHFLFHRYFGFSH